MKVHSLNRANSQIKMRNHFKVYLIIENQRNPKVNSQTILNNNSNRTNKSSIGTVTPTATTTRNEMAVEVSHMDHMRGNLNALRGEALAPIEKIQSFC